MKYCAKCGHTLEDDMAFCPECGTKRHERQSGQSDALLDSQIEKLKSYTVHFEPSVIDWGYILGLDVQGRGELATKQDHLCLEMVDLIESLVEKCRGNSSAEREVYSCALEEAAQLIFSAKTLLDDYELMSRMQEGFASRIGIERTTRALNESDKDFRSVASLQLLHASRIKKALDVNVIRGSKAYREKVLKLANSLAETWGIYVRRECSFFEVSSNGGVFKFVSINSIKKRLEDIWGFYMDIVEGLNYNEIETLDLSKWEDQPKELNSTDKAFWDGFIKVMHQQLNDLKNKEDALMWNAHPEKKARKTELDAEIGKIKVELAPKLTERDALAKHKKRLEEVQQNSEKRIAENEARIIALKKKLFGKTKAQAEAISLEDENDLTRSEMTKARDDEQEIEGRLAAVEAEIEQKEKLIDELENQIVALR